MMASAADGELILKLYELRTESLMREARKFVLNFNPTTFDELAAVQRGMGTDNNAYWRQTLSYWDMAINLVLHGALDAELFVAANGEPFFYYAKFSPFHEEYQRTFAMPFMRTMGLLIEQHPSAKAKYEIFLARLHPKKG